MVSVSSRHNLSENIIVFLFFLLELQIALIYYSFYIYTIIQFWFNRYFSI